MRPPYIFLILLFFATSLGSSGCGFMEHLKNPNSLSSRVGNFSPAKLDADKEEMRAAKNVTPLIRGSRDLDGRQEQFDPAFGNPETQTELNQERAEMNAARKAVQGQLNAPHAQLSGPINQTPALTAPVTGFAGKGSQFGSPNTENVASQNSSLASSGKLNPSIYGTPSSSASLQPSSPGANPKVASAASSTAKHSPVAIVQSPDSSRFGLAHGHAKPTTFAPTRSATPISDIPSSANSSQNQGFGCPPAGMVSLGGASSSSLNTNQFGAVTSASPRTTSIASAPRNNFPASPPQVAYPTAPQPTLSAVPPQPANTVSPGIDSSLPPIDPNAARVAPTPAPARNFSRLESSPTVQTSSGWDFKSFRLPSFKLPFFPSSKSKPSRSSSSEPASANAGDLEIVNAQNDHARNVMVTITAVVKKLLPDDRDGSPHQRFLLGLSNGTTVLVAHNISLAPYVPLREGDLVTISGEYIWNEKGGVLHYTHHTTNRKHRGGYIEYNRQTYQ